jgi:hypothetical protein
VLWLFGLDIALLVIVAFLWTVLNTVVIQGASGQSLGKMVLGTQLILPVLTGEGVLLVCVPGIGRCAGRLFIHCTLESCRTRRGFSWSASGGHCGTSGG